jgi:hypothetical protein
MLVTMRSALTPLTDALRDAHEALSETVRGEIERREKLGVPLDDATDFAAVGLLTVSASNAAEALDGAAVRECAQQILAMCSGGLKPLPPYEANPEYEGIMVRLRSVSEGERIATAEAIDACASAAERHSVFVEYVRKAVCEIRGIEDESGPVTIEGDGLTEEQAAMLDAAGLISDLWSVARRYAELPASKKKHFGSLAPSNSQSSTVAPAQSSGDSSSDATAAPAQSTDSQTTSQTPALAGTS